MTEDQARPAPEAVQVVVGAVGKPFGTRGQNYVRPDPDTSDGFAAARSYRVLGGPAGHPATLTVAAGALHSGRWIVRFEGSEDREGAEALRGCVLGLPRSQVPLAEDAYWTTDLLGRAVVDDDGAAVGTVTGAADGAAHDYLLVTPPGGGQLMIPAIAEFVDVTHDRVVVHPIPGLLDDKDPPGRTQADDPAPPDPSP